MPWSWGIVGDVQRAALALLHTYCQLVLAEASRLACAAVEPAGRSSASRAGAPASVATGSRAKGASQHAALSSTALVQLLDDAVQASAGCTSGSPPSLLRADLEQLCWSHTAASPHQFPCTAREATC